jgi:nucleotide-binding universal stress UspA family protein
MNGTYDTILWATDGSDGAEAALDEARSLAALTGGRISAVHCDQRLSGRAGGWSRYADESDRVLTIARRVEELQDEGVPIDLVVRRSRTEPADVVAAVADELNADLIVVGTRGLNTLSMAFIGSFTQRLLHIAPCPVLAVGPRSGLNETARRMEARVHA